MLLLIKNLIVAALIVVAIAVFLAVCLASMLWFFIKKLFRKVVPAEE